MINEKEQTLKTVDTLPNEISDELYVQYMKEILRESEEDIKNGRVMTIEESIERMRKKYDEFYVDYMKKLLKESEEQFKNGKFITLEEFEKEMEAKYENSHVRYGKTEHFSNYLNL